MATWLNVVLQICFQISNQLIKDYSLFVLIVVLRWHSSRCIRQIALHCSCKTEDETSFWLKKLLMHLNWAIHNVCNLNIDPHTFFPKLVTGSGSANPVSTARGLSATQREACMCSLTTQKPKRLPRVIMATWLIVALKICFQISKRYVQIDYRLFLLRLNCRFAFIKMHTANSTAL